MIRTMIGCLALGLLWHAMSDVARAAEKGSNTGRALVVKLMGDADPEFRAVAFDQVRGAYPGEAATKEFAAILEQLKEPAQQVGLLSALADRRDAAARPEILKLLTASSDERVRSAAIRALAMLGSAKELPLIVNALSAQSTVERASAKLALTQMRGDEITSSLAVELKSASPAVKAALIEVLATRRASNEIPTFLAAALDDNAQVRTAAMSALGQIGGPDQIAPMLACILKAPKGGERDGAEKNVALICARIDNEDQRGEALIKALDTVSPADRDQLLSLVGRVGGKKLIKFVADIATGSDARRRKLGVDALSKWPDASPADTLLEIARQAGSPEDRAAAFQGYVKVASMRDKRNDKQRLDRMKQALKEARADDEKTLVIRLARTAYDVETLRFVLPYVDESPFSQIACETIVELAHHREVRDPNKAEFDKALDRVIAASSNPEVIERANRYKRGETWDRATKGK
jgi:HEAT repeat protein